MASRTGVRLSRTAGLRNSYPRRLPSGDAKGRATARFSAKLNDELYERLRELEESSKLTKAAIVEAIIVQMRRDILDHQRPALQRDLKELLKVAA
jgi:predicted DNA-binding protein